MAGESWEHVKSEILRLYVEEKRTLQHVMNIMRSRHSFIASRREYRQHLKQWKVGKYSSEQKCNIEEDDIQWEATSTPNPAVDPFQKSRSPFADSAYLMEEPYMFGYSASPSMAMIHPAPAQPFDMNSGLLGVHSPDDHAIDINRGMLGVHSPDDPAPAQPFNINRGLLGVHSPDDPAPAQPFDMNRGLLGFHSPDDPAPAQPFDMNSGLLGVHLPDDPAPAQPFDMNSELLGAHSPDDHAIDMNSGLLGVHSPDDPAPAQPFDMNRGLLGFHSPDNHAIDVNGGMLGFHSPDDQAMVLPIRSAPALFVHRSYSPLKPEWEDRLAEHAAESFVESKPKRLSNSPSQSSHDIIRSEGSDTTRATGSTGDPESRQRSKLALDKALRFFVSWLDGFLHVQKAGGSTVRGASDGPSGKSCQSDGGTTQSTSSLPGEFGLATSGSQGQHVAPKKRLGAGDGDGDGEDDQPPEPRSAKRPKAADDEGVKYACPYAKHNPWKYMQRNPCCGPGWKTVARIKEHIYRCHSRSGFVCPRCYKMFKSDSHLAVHLRAASPCQTLLRDPNSDDGITPDIALVLRSRKYERERGVSLTEESKWRQMYSIIFPDIAKDDIPSPFYDGNFGAAHNLRGFELFLRRDLPVTVRNDLRDELERNPTITEEGGRRLVSFLMDLIPRYLLRAFGAYLELGRQRQRGEVVDLDDAGEDQAGPVSATGLHGIQQDESRSGIVEIESSQGLFEPLGDVDFSFLDSIAQFSAPSAMDMGGVGGDFEEVFMDD